MYMGHACAQVNQIKIIFCSSVIKKTFIHFVLVKTVLKNLDLALFDD